MASLTERYDERIAGVSAFTTPGQAPTTLSVFNSVAANNGYGVAAQGTGAILRIAQSMVTGNATGWATFSSGVLLNAGDNTI